MANTDIESSRLLQEDSSTTCRCPDQDTNTDYDAPQSIQMLSMGGGDAYLNFISDRFESRVSLFKERTGHSVKVVGLGDSMDVLSQEILADTEAKVYDGYCFLPFLAGSVLEKGGLADLTEMVRTNADINWPDIFPFNREVQSVFDNSVRLLPCDGDVHSLYYRKDLFEQHNITVPRTWDEYTEVAKYFHGMEVPAAKGNGTVTMTGSCVGRKPDCLDFGFFNVLVHSSSTQISGTKRGALLDPKTFQPLMGEAMAETLRHLENQLKYGAQDELVYEQCSGLNIERMNTMGNCAMTYQWGDVFARHMLEDSVTEGKLGISVTPGSSRVLDRETLKLVDCTEELCPHGETYDDIGRISYAPYAAAGGWSVGVSAGVNPARQKAMVDFFGLVCGEKESQADVIPNATGPIGGADPYRRSHFDVEKWVANGYPREATVNYKDTVTKSLSSDNTVIDIWFPDADKFLSAMHTRMFTHLNESRTSEKTIEDRLQVANEIEASWKQLTEDYNQRDTTTLPLLARYQQSLSIYIPPEAAEADSDKSLSTGAVAGIAIGAALVAALLSCIVFYWTLRKERKKSLMHWEIKREDLQLTAEVIGEGSFGVVVKGAMRGTPVAVKPSAHAYAASDNQFSRSSTLRRINSADGSSRIDEFSTERKSTLGFGQRQIKEDLSALTKLRNPHVVQTIGAMINKKTMFVVFEFCENGNLSAALGDAAGVAGAEGRAFELQWALQIAKGLQFLHSVPEPLGPLLHEDLKASNVLLDSSFNAKLSNFSLESRVVGSRPDQGSLLWTAPEVLNGERPSRRSDMYSYGMLLFEIVARARPFRVRRFSKSNLTSYTVSTIFDPAEDIVPSAEENAYAEYFGSIDGEQLTLPEIISRVSDLTTEPAVRPVPPKNAPVLLRDLSVECWNKNPDRRPWIDEVVRRLSAQSSAIGLTKSLAMRTSIFDSILPTHIQEALSRNEVVPPQKHDNVTVIFSDIVSFTSTSSKLTASEVGDLISRLFTKYDGLAEKYGVKKLDVIGDAFLGVAGLLPDETPDHAPRAAGFALEAIEVAMTTPICPAKPELGNVGIRFGLATGPVVASVIGSLKYPKFTLFGTTVNTASRMESSSQPGRVQCTNETADLVKEQQPAIGVKFRGQMDIKGRGKLDTFFLDGPANGNFKSLRPTGGKKEATRLSMGDIMVQDDGTRLPLDFDGASALFALDAADDALDASEDAVGGGDEEHGVPNYDMIVPTKAS